MGLTHKKIEHLHGFQLQIQIPFDANVILITAAKDGLILIIFLIPGSNVIEFDLDCDAAC